MTQFWNGFVGGMVFLAALILVPVFLLDAYNRVIRERRAASKAICEPWVGVDGEPGTREYAENVLEMLGPGYAIRSDGEWYWVDNG